MRSGSQYLDSLEAKREVYVDGRRVEHVLEHEAFRPIAETIAALYDTASDHKNQMIYHSPEIDADANRVFSIPRTHEELVLRRKAIETWANQTHGWVGRSPDHVGAFIAAFASNPNMFARQPHDLGQNVVNYHKKILQESLYVSYAIIPPQVSRATTAHGWAGDYLQVGVVAEDADGIMVRGSQMLATGAVVADELFVSCIKPLTPEDAKFAVSFALPITTPGLKLYCRRPYASGDTSVFDYPLTSQFDETDSLVVFDDVKVPWDRVFVNQVPSDLSKQFYGTGAHVMGNSQAQIRFVTKLRFMAGLARKVAAVNGADKFPGVQEKLGELASLASLVEAAVFASEYNAEPDNEGMWRPQARPLYGAMGMQAEIYPRVLAIVRDLTGGGVLQLPATVNDVLSEDEWPDIERYVQSPGVPAVERIKLFKLVWDAIGSEFAGRHHQYEMFYAGAPFIAKGHSFRNFDYDDAVSRVEGFLSTYKAEAL
ncbi:4-hydroxyphenylacetate 3-hydroxylase family protein [Ornithinimicrobium cryptoxanthini]|uniref:4-hydroxyphenylacetate 3-hydroxylase n=1 Tax=Ornithinimicrobium cryptoxanthini TaxID=2934161 RepID=A0ABY4YM01_9MICO|nr:4-hydroxyphenylacetate 3-hydroxylase N-terminal domain-containing protein [Ornithinimicrobium cryptoxanthini]USQ77812.1 4-hydroxyphenylacetate 3-hydroxylase [Ornithinimicrobium cryptoxanthini]